MLAKIGCMVLLTTVIFLRVSSLEYYNCSHLEYNRCVKIADPLVREAHLIFPDNVEDIDTVCRTWNKFVDCLKRFTDDCFSDEQRRKFNKAVSNPIESVHKMCMDQVYQQEYLQYATCIKRTITDIHHCGRHYSSLVDQVAQEDNADISKATICCFQERFRKCVERETRLFCDDGLIQGPALQFSVQIIDKALSFLEDQCYNYIPNSGDCTTMSSTTELSDKANSIHTVPSVLYPWATNFADGLKHNPKDLNLPSSTPWIPSGSQITTENSMLDSTQLLGSRTRPASYGRSNSWLPVTRTQNNLHIHRNDGKSAEDLSSTVKTSERLSPRPDWVTTQTSSIPNRKTSYTTYNIENAETGNIVTHSTETWYPAAGNQLSNEVDEPNQQGLSYRKNSSFFAKGISHMVYIGTTAFYYIYFIYST